MSLDKKPHGFTMLYPSHQRMNKGEKEIDEKKYFTAGSRIAGRLVKIFIKLKKKTIKKMKEK